MQLAAQLLAEIVAAIRKEDRSAAGSDKRRFARFAVNSRVEVLSHATGRAYTALTRDLSLEGVGLISTVTVAKGERLSISLPRERAASLVAQCTVIHAGPLADGIWAVGVLFLSAATLQSATADPAEAKRIAEKMLS
jgi:hypothetical protein